MEKNLNSNRTIKSNHSLIISIKKFFLQLLVKKKMRILFVLFAAMSASSIPSNRLSDETRDDWDICVCSKSLSFLGYFWEYFIYTNFLNKKILFFLHKKVCFFYTKIFFFLPKILFFLHQKFCVFYTKNFAFF